jgi:hypothetical protein
MIRRTLIAAACAAATLAAAAPVAGAASADWYTVAPRSASINVQDGFPLEVRPDHFADLTGSVATGWKLGIDGVTLAEPGALDGVNSIGFSNALPDDVLGAYIYWPRRVYAVKKVCKRKHGKRRCHRVKRYRYSEVTEADVAFNASFRWNEGPRYPGDGEIDLESVEIHELGHFNDPNRQHGARCSGSPLTESLAYGEWWRGQDDWFEYGCSNSPSKLLAKTTPLRLAARYERVEHRLPDRVIGAGR